MTARTIATLDLGTNTLLLLVGRQESSGKLTLLRNESAVVRLGEGLRATGKIAPHVLERVLKATREFVKISRDAGATEIVLTATAAAREAANGHALMSSIEAIGGVRMEILPPEEEGRLEYISVARELGGNEPSVVIDIGGGSTEFSWGRGPKFEDCRSLDLGTVKLIEGPLKNDPPSPAELETARIEIDAALSKLPSLANYKRFFGTAGSFTMLASVDRKIPEYDPKWIDGTILTRRAIDQWTERLSVMKATERNILPGGDPRRADVLLAGTLIIERIMEHLHISTLTVYDRGVRFGKLFDMLATEESSS